MEAATEILIRYIAANGRRQKRLVIHPYQVFDDCFICDEAKSRLFIRVSLASFDSLEGPCISRKHER